MAEKKNVLADKLVSIATRQLQQSYMFKLPRITQIRKFRSLYNNQVIRQLRIRYNAPIPVFSGMMDTLSADLDDSLILKFGQQDPADWKSCEKANAYLREEMESPTPGARWDSKFRAAREEVKFTGRGFLKYNASNEDGFKTELSAPAYEDMFWEPKGRGHLENHLYRGQINNWKTKKQLREDSQYSKSQVSKLLAMGPGNEYKMSSLWENYDYSNRFLPLGLSAESYNYVGEEMFNLVDWELCYEGKYWYLVFEPYTATWLTCDKLTEFNSSGLSHWMSFASHEDSKNFASKGFADDLYPVAMMLTDMFNEEAEWVRRRNSGGIAYDKDMFTDVAKLDLALLGRDAMVPADTKGGVRRIDQGLYRFATPEISGVADFRKSLQDLVGTSMGVTKSQMGDQGDNPRKAVGITYAEQGAISKRLSFESKPMLWAGQELCLRVWGGLVDYLKEPLSVQILGESGYEMAELKRVDLNINRDFKVSVKSKNQEDQINQLASKNKMEALHSILEPVDPSFKGNIRTVNEHRLREGGWSEEEISAILDENTHADKRTLAETSAAIQLLMQGKTPPINYNANFYFMGKIVDFVKTHMGDQKVKNNLANFDAYIKQISVIAQDNEARMADQLIQDVQRKQLLSGQGGGPPSPTGAPAPQPAGIPQ